MLEKLDVNKPSAETNPAPRYVYAEPQTTMLDDLYLVGGQQRGARALLENGENWYDYQKGIILRAHPRQGQAALCLEYISPRAVRGDQNAVLFKCSTRLGNRLYVVTQTEILTFLLPELRRVGYISLPAFNDVHHVRPMPDGTLLVANSGLEMVQALSPEGEVLYEWNTLGQHPWARFSKEIDYRRVSTKPHRSHPNFLFLVGEEIWVTRFEQMDAICLTRPEKHIDIGIERVHDGLLYDDRLYFTTVDGHVVIANPSTCKVEEVINLNRLSDPETLLGWCRGILVEGSRAWVGFSQIRPTRFRETVNWIRQGFQRSLPTHIGLYDLAKKELVAEFATGSYGLDAVFSILPAGPQPEEGPVLRDKSGSRVGSGGGGG